MTFSWGAHLIQGAQQPCIKPLAEGVGGGSFLHGTKQSCFSFPALSPPCLPACLPSLVRLLCSILLSLWINHHPPSHANTHTPLNIIYLSKEPGFSWVAHKLFTAFLLQKSLRFCGIIAAVSSKMHPKEGGAMGDRGCYKYPPHTPSPPPNIHIPPSLSVESTSARTVYCRVPPLACRALFSSCKGGTPVMSSFLHHSWMLACWCKGEAAIHFMSLDCLYHMCVGYCSLCSMLMTGRKYCTYWWEAGVYQIKHYITHRTNTHVPVSPAVKFHVD